MRRAGIGVVLLIGLLTAAPAADAISRSDADRAALRALEPEDRKGNVAVYRLPRPLRPGTIVAEGLDRPATRPRDVPGFRLERGRAWMYWMDLDNGAMFGHPSVLLMIDDFTGRVALRRNFDWFPLVNAKLPAFLRSGRAFDSRRYRIFTSRPRREAPPQAPRPFAQLAQDDQLQLPENAFAGDCIIAVGDRGPDERMRDDFEAMERQSMRLGVPYFTISGLLGKRVTDDGASLKKAVDKLVTEEACRDILFYVHGHGSGRPRAAGVETAGRYAIRNGRTRNIDPGYVRPDDIGEIIDKHTQVTFKLKVDSCFAGRFEQELPMNSYPRLLVVETSSRADEPSYLQLPWVMLADGTRLDNDTNPRRGTHDYLSEFTNRNIVGWERFATSLQQVTVAQQAGGSFFAQMLDRGYGLGAPDDFAARTEKTHTGLRTNHSGGNPQPSSDFTVSVNVNHMHIGPGNTKLCWRIRTNPRQPRGTARVRVRGKAVMVGTQPADATANDEGEVLGELTIGDFDEYTVDVTFTAADGTERIGTDTHIVGMAQGACPPPP